ncbi:molybdenum cofactor synthesis domain protein [Haloterrigena turkmenica DSM 5511]|uniref:Molybdenum cofactor synthesis domain protein n=1 Tax=Haloterrigena turkmenica (strain ATCC 51198 / DSM 5511 / JCM 9101 / NCIMB 13204 / VKM B-1734 / 4k) TaxID=543526 RepID=D2RX48_HALTV|nr:molybdopterin-binding protein [Haloterrigena turkmenica]ADB59660.1 molybdenum cofactor synthesis domain protein [Haloterrigena turkmenica DSM 5511]
MTETDSSEDRQRAATEEPAPDEERDTDEQPPDEGNDIDGRSLGVGVVTIAADRSLESDGAGEAIVSGLKKADHEVATREHIGADHDRIQSTVSRLLDRDDVDVIVTGGATSIEPSDVTIEAVEPLLEKRLSAFEDLYTTLSYEAVGTRVVAARTIAGVSDGTPVFCLPGNEDAARLGLEELILPEVHNLVSLAREDIAQDRWAVDEAALEEGEATGDERDREGEGEKSDEGETTVDRASEPDDGGE